MGWLGLYGLGEVCIHLNIVTSFSLLFDRLLAYDRVDPYVALYDAPEPSVVGTFSHRRWRGDVLPRDSVRAALEGFLRSALLLYSLLSFRFSSL